MFQCHSDSGFQFCLKDLKEESLLGVKLRLSCANLLNTNMAKSASSLFFLTNLNKDIISSDDC